MRQHPANITSGIPHARTQPSGWVYQGDDPATGETHLTTQSSREYAQSHDYQEASPGTWTRNFSHETASNQLDTMNDGGGTTRSYDYDAAGNLTQENTNRKHEWD